MQKKLLILITATCLLLAAVPVWAHHAFAAEFDGNKLVKLRGTVTKMEWINPHAWLHIDVKGVNGSVVSWMIELGPPNALIKRGWTKKDVPAGIELLVDGYQTVGCVPVDVGELDVDFYVGGCLKWLSGGPGTAFAYVRAHARRGSRIYTRL